MKNLLFLAVAASIFIATFSLDSAWNFVGLNFDGSDGNLEGSNGLRMIWIFVCMLIGIAFGQGYRVVSVDRKLSLKNLLNADLWRSLLSSPIVFGAVYLGVRGQPDVVVASILAFENGFICNVIAEKRLARLTDGNIDEPS